MATDLGFPNDPSNLETDILNQQRYSRQDQARMFDPAIVADPLNKPAGVVRWNAALARWEKWDGVSAWVVLAAALAHDISGNAGSVTNGVYTVGDQTIGGNKTFTGAMNITSGTLRVGSVGGIGLNANPFNDAGVGRVRLRAELNGLWSTPYGELLLGSDGHASWNGGFSTIGGNITSSDGIAANGSEVCAGSGQVGEKRLRLWNANRSIYWSLTDVGGLNLYDATAGISRLTTDASGNAYVAGNLSVGGGSIAGTASNATALGGVAAANYARQDVVPVFSNTQGGTEGGEIRLARAAAGYTAGNLDNDLVIDVNSNLLRMFGGSNTKGAFLDIAKCAAGSASELYHTGNKPTISDVLDNRTYQTVTRTSGTTYTNTTGRTIQVVGGATLNSSPGLVVTVDDGSGPVTIITTTVSNVGVPYCFEVKNGSSYTIICPAGFSVKELR